MVTLRSAQPKETQVQMTRMGLLIEVVPIERMRVTKKSVTVDSWSAQHHVYVTYMVMTGSVPTGQLNVGRVLGWPVDRQTGRSEFKLADGAFLQRKDSSNPTYPEQNSRAPAKLPRRPRIGT